MPRVVPSDVVKAAERMFPDMVRNPRAFPGVEAHAVPSFAGFASLVDAVPAELLVLDPTSYTGVVASVAYLRALADVFQASRDQDTLRTCLFVCVPSVGSRWTTRSMCGEGDAKADLSSMAAFGIQPSLRARGESRCVPGLFCHLCP